MMHIRDIPSGWVCLLDEIRVIAPDAHIAGGALRDLDNGRTVKDIDIFIPAEHDVAVELLSMELGFERDAAVDLSSMVGSDPAVRSSVTWKKEGHLPVNAIYLTSAWTPRANIERLDLGLCQIAFDGQMLHTTEAYYTDRYLEQMTVMRADNEAQLDRTIKRAERLNRKYIGWDLVIPRSIFEVVWPK